MTDQHERDVDFESWKYGRPNSRKRIRLPAEAYAVPGSVWHITIAAFRRQNVLVSPGTPEVIIESIGFHCRRGNADLLVYCLMPDHFHLVVTINDVDLLTILHDFKSFTTNRFRKRTKSDVLWQESFYDHGVRKSERMDKLASYVVSNPIDDGLVDDWREWPWIGGSLIDAGEILNYTK